MTCLSEVEVTGVQRCPQHRPGNPGDGGEADPVEADDAVRRQAKTLEAGAGGEGPLLVVEVGDRQVVEQDRDRRLVAPLALGGVGDRARRGQGLVELRVAVAPVVAGARGGAAEQRRDVEVRVDPARPADEVGLEPALPGAVETAPPI